MEAKSKGGISLEQFEHKWLASLIYWCIDIHVDDKVPLKHIDTKRSEMILVALMQVKSEIALEAARTLLHHKWPGHKALSDFFWSLAEELDKETQSKWITRMGMSMRQSDDKF